LSVSKREAWGKSERSKNDFVVNILLLSVQNRIIYMMSRFRSGSMEENGEIYKKKWMKITRE